MGLFYCNLMLPKLLLMAVGRCPTKVFYHGHANYQLVLELSMEAKFHIEILGLLSPLQHFIFPLDLCYDMLNKVTRFSLVVCISLIHLSFKFWCGGLERWIIFSTISSLDTPILKHSEFVTVRLFRLVKAHVLSKWSTNCAGLVPNYVSCCKTFNFYIIESKITTKKNNLALYIPNTFGMGP